MVTATGAKRHGSVCRYTEQESSKSEFGDRDQRRSCAVCLTAALASPVNVTAAFVTVPVFVTAANAVEFGNRDIGVRMQRS